MRRRAGVSGSSLYTTGILETAGYCTIYDSAKIPTTRYVVRSLNDIASAMRAPAPIQVKEIARTIRVLIADDHADIRRMVRSTLEQHPHFQVCGEACDGGDAIKEAQRLNPDVVVLNVHMPVLNGFEAAREIRTTLPKTAIVILSSDADKRFIEEAKRIGARAFVAKEKVSDDLINAIEAAVTGGDFASME